MIYNHHYKTNLCLLRHCLNQRFITLYMYLRPGSSKSKSLFHDRIPNQLVCTELDLALRQVPKNHRSAMFQTHSSAQRKQHRANHHAMTDHLIYIYVQPQLFRANSGTLRIYIYVCVGVI